MKVFVIDQKYCNGCHACQIACKDEHCGNDWMPYQKAQPELGHFWMKLEETTHGQVPKVKVEYLPYMCQQCDNPPCQICDAVVKRDDGLVSIDPERSKGRRDIMEACPYGAIYWNDELDIPQKCDGCAHLVDAGEMPHCVELCPTGALRFGEEEDLALDIMHATTLYPEYGTNPRVYVLNTPGLFISGDVWDPKTDEVIIGADVTLTKPDGSVEKATTDDFGDFWFRNLEKGSYSVAIQNRGYADVAREGIDLDRSLNIGDFPLRAVEIPHDLSIQGKVSDRDTHELIAGADITLIKPDKSEEKTTTDAAGCFRFDQLESGTYSVVIKTEGYTEAGKRGLKLERSMDMGEYRIKHKAHLW